MLFRSYETAYRQRNIEGFLPVSVGVDPADAQVPVFSWRSAAEGTSTIDLQTGLVHPGQMTADSFRLEGVVVRKVGPPEATPKPVVQQAAPERRHSARAHTEKAHRKKHVRHHEHQ